MRLHLFAGVKHILRLPPVPETAPLAVNTRLPLITLRAGMVVAVNIKEF
jgi:hypothetical protein